MSDKGMSTVNYRKGKVLTFIVTENASVEIHLMRMDQQQSFFILI